MQAANDSPSRCIRRRIIFFALPALMGLVALILWKGRGEWWSPFDRYAHLNSVDADETLRTAFKTKDRLKFRSWDGVWIGTDIDTELTLFPDGTATLKHFGDGVDRVTGTYSTDGSLVVVVADSSKLAETIGSEDWPPLRVKFDKNDILLIPDRKTTALSYGWSSAWPLRRIE